MQPYFSVDDLHEQERAAGKRRTDEERDLVTELHPQPAPERGHENGPHRAARRMPAAARPNPIGIQAQTAAVLRSRVLRAAPRVTMPPEEMRRQPRQAWTQRQQPRL